MISISHPSKIIDAQIDLPASKSISNRLLIIHYLMSESFDIKHLSNCEDTQYLQQSIKSIKDARFSNGSNLSTLDVGEAGTSFRFLTVLLAFIPGTYKLTGSHKLMHRPILPLIEVLKQLGAQVWFEKGESGPLIFGDAEISGGEVELDAGISSQFVTALLLVAPYFKNGLTIKLKGNIVSRTYIQLTVNLMRVFGAEVLFENNIAAVKYRPYQANVKDYFVESDWTAASYWFAMAILSNESRILLKGLFKQSMQGDRIIADLCTIYGIKSEFLEEGLLITKTKQEGFIHIFDFIDHPDLVQTFAFLNAALRLPLKVNGASNLIHKETDRISAIAKELSKIGARFEINNYHDFSIEPEEKNLSHNPVFETYKDHRMAMSAAMLALKLDRAIIKDETVVRKSYPYFWEHMTVAGFEIKNMEE